MFESTIAQNPVETQEVWKAIPGYPGYQVSDFGRIKSYWKKGKHNAPMLVIPKFQKLFIKPANNRIYVNMKTQVGKYFTPQVHTLVLTAFIGPRPEGFQACHNDGDCHNNHISNLRWDTPKSNSMDALKHGTMIIGEKSPFSKLKNEDILIIRNQFADGINPTKIANQFHIHKNTLYAIVKGKKWKHIGGPITLTRLKRYFDFDKLGENNHKSVLKNAEVIEILNLLKQGISTRKVASLFHVTQGTIGAIKSRRSWRKFQEELANKPI